MTLENKAALGAIDAELFSQGPIGYLTGFGMISQPKHCPAPCRWEGTRLNGWHMGCMRSKSPVRLLPRRVKPTDAVGSIVFAPGQCMRRLSPIPIAGQARRYAPTPSPIPCDGTRCLFRRNPPTSSIAGICLPVTVRRSRCRVVPFIFIAQPNRWGIVIFTMAMENC